MPRSNLLAIRDRSAIRRASNAVHSDSASSLVRADPIRQSQATIQLSIVVDRAKRQGSCPTDEAIGESPHSGAKIVSGEFAQVMDPRRPSCAEARAHIQNTHQFVCQITTKLKEVMCSYLRDGLWFANLIRVKNAGRAVLALALNSAYRVTFTGKMA
jgi:hypothetical protein